MWRAAALLITFLLPVVVGITMSHASDLAEPSGLVSMLDKAGVVGCLCAGLYFLGKEVVRARAHTHTMRNHLVNCHQAREMWKTATVQYKTVCDTHKLKVEGLNIADLFAREERLLREEAATAKT